MKMIHVLNGPNLNLLGQREPGIYGSDTLEDVERLCRAACAPGFDIEMAQTNHEGRLVDLIQSARGVACGIAINPAAYTHTSVAILDALNTFDGPVIEVHLSNIHRREEWRHRSYVSLRADGIVAGFGVEGYGAAIRRICQMAG
jgi:3-dehydroquinate dehydratase-2